MKLQTYEEQMARKADWIDQIQRFIEAYPSARAFLEQLASYITERTRDVSEAARWVQEYQHGDLTKDD